MPLQLQQTSSASLPHRQTVGLFTAVKFILDDSFAGLNAAARAADAKRVAAYLAQMSGEYRTGYAPRIPYHEPLCRMAYIFNNLGIGASIVRDVVRRDRELMRYLSDAVNERGRLRICAFGGGPGTEALAFSSLLREFWPDVQADLEVVVVDGEPGWGESFNQMRRYIRSVGTGGVRHHISGDFVHFDMRELRRYRKSPGFFDCDVFVSNYVASELFDKAANSQMARVFAQLGKYAPRGAWLVLADRSSVAEDIHELVRQCVGWSAHKHVDSERFVMPYHEDKAALGEYISLFGRLPRVNAWTCSAIARKL